jgi:pimeloyl-ACP methyl ester carboxylesterase
MVPFYFGPPHKPLFGCYHEPRSGHQRHCGVILCPPLAYEYINSHRAYRQLAVRLSHVGFPVLLFDFYGSGDSGGDDELEGIPPHLSDISTAIDEIRRRSGLAKVCLVGLRLGGTLSMMAGAERGDVEGLVLWDPVVDGRAYIREMTTVHQDVLGPSFSRPKLGTTNGTATEILGFALAHSLLADLESIDLLAIRRRPAKSTLVLESDGGGGARGLSEYLKSTETRLEYQLLPGPRIWLPDREGGLLVPAPTLQSIVAWIARLQP